MFCKSVENWFLINYLQKILLEYSGTQPIQFSLAVTIQSGITLHRLFNFDESINHIKCIKAKAFVITKA